MAANSFTGFFTGAAFRFFTALVITAFGLASCATPPFRVNESRVVPEDFFGLISYSHPLEPEDFSLMDRLGVVWQRRTCYWSGVEPAPGVWNFSDWDKYVEDSKNGGKKILAILAYDTPWLHEEKAPRKITARELPAFLNYVRTVAARYRGKIDAYEIWNEPNMMHWDGSDEEFITMTRAAVKEIRSVDPGVKILAGSFWRVPGGFIRKMLRAGVFAEADGLSFHPYAVTPGGSVELCDSLFEILREENFSGEIWITEAGYPTRGWYPTTVSEKNLPSHVVKTLAGFAVRNINGMMWYELYDSYNPGEYTVSFDSEKFFGLAYPDRTVKQGFYAFALCGRNLAGKTYRPELPLAENLPERTVSLCFTGSGGGTLILWNERGASYSAKITLPGSDGRVYDISDGSFAVVNGETEITVSKTPLFFTWTEAPAENAARDALLPKLSKR